MQTHATVVDGGEETGRWFTDRTRIVHAVSLGGRWRRVRSTDGARDAKGREGFGALDPIRVF